MLCFNHIFLGMKLRKLYTLFGTLFCSYDDKTNLRMWVFCAAVLAHTTPTQCPSDAHTTPIQSTCRACQTPIQRSYAMYGLNVSEHMSTLTLSTSHPHERCMGVAWALRRRCMGEHSSARYPHSCYYYYYIELIPCLLY